jgi:hypothetical protein
LKLQIKQQFKIDDLIVKNNIQSYQIQELSIINTQQFNKLQDCNNKTLELLNNKNQQLLDKNKDIQITNDTLGLLNSCNKHLQ